jgi:DNA-binding NarL/FixJ family response regulator
MIRLFIIEDHPVIVSGLRNILRPSRDKIEIVYSINDIRDILGMTDPGLFDIIILDLFLPSGNPVENLKLLEDVFPGKPVVIYTNEPSFHWQQKMFKAGASAYLVKTAERPEIKSVIERVYRGEIVKTRLMEQFESRKSILNLPEPDSGLTPFQHQVLIYLSQGRTTKEIAGLENKSDSSIQKTLKHIRELFHAKSNIELVQLFTRLNQK